MEIQIVSIDDLSLDENNARIHDEKNLAAIKGSLQEFGQRKPIVINDYNMVIAGNGTVVAAGLLGWTKIETVKIPSDWTEEQTKAFALADNRTAELGTWDNDILAQQLIELQDVDFLIEQIGFLHEEPKVIDDSTESVDWEDKYEVLIDCENEFQQQELLVRLSGEGYKVRAMLI